MKNKLKIIIILIFTCSFLQGSCQKKNTAKMTKYEWLPTETAPKNYPVYLYKGYFTANDGSIIRIPDKRTVYYGWGEIGSIHISGDDFKTVPKKLSLTWLSYPEKKYYKLETKLPQKQIDSLFQLELNDPKNQKTEHFNYIGVGISPGGMVSVWMIGTGYQVEIGNYFGAKTEIDFKEMMPTTDLNQQEFTDMILKDQVEDSVLNEIKARKIPYQRWKNYRKKYNWQVALKNKEEFIPNQARVIMLNGEQDVQYFNTDIQPLLETWAVPSSTRIQWQDKNGNQFVAKIFFNEQEITKAFETIFSGRDKKAILTIYIGRFNDIIKIILSNNENEMELKKHKIKIY